VENNTVGDANGQKKEGGKKRIRKAVHKRNRSARLTPQQVSIKKGTKNKTGGGEAEQ